MIDETIFANGFDPRIQDTVRQDMVEKPLMDMNRLAREASALASMAGI